LLLDYAFRLKNLRRVWLEVLASNERAIRSCGFVEEGRMHEHVWLDGRYLDNVLMGILGDEWRR
jgi:RimJ/RimL family protein N-acetyltransferase